LVPLWIAGSACAQQPAPARTNQGQTQPRSAPDTPENHRPPLFFREAWKHSGEPEHPISQDSVSNPNLDLKLYGDQPRSSHSNGHEGDGGIWDNKRPSPLDDPAHTFTGTCKKPCGLAFRDKNNYVDLTGFAKIVWRVKAEGFHAIRPLVKLADGTYLVGDHADGYAPDWHVSEFTLFDLRWRRLDPKEVVTATGALAGWVVNPDLSKVDEIGFVDLMPGSGHGNGGWTDLAWMEVWGNPVKR
jgi:hypothetical protein